MFLNQTDMEILSNLKGRTSKLLSGSKKATIEERAAVEKVYKILDEIILWNRKITKTKSTYFKKQLLACANYLQTSKKRYIQENIIPLINRIANQEWVS